MATTRTKAAAGVEEFAANANQALKDGIEKSMTAVAEINDHSKKNLEAVVASVTLASKSAETLGASVLAFSKKSLEDQVAAAKSLAGAKSVQDVIELQTSFAKTAFEAYVAEMSRVTEAFTTSMKDSMAPITERVTVMAERLQVTH